MKRSFNDFYKSISPAKRQNKNLLSGRLPRKPLINKPKRKKKRKTYPQNWTPYNLAQVNEKRLFFPLLHELLTLVDEEVVKRRGRPSLSIRDMIFACCTKTYIDRSARRSSSDIRTLQEKGLLTKPPHFNTVLRYLNDPALTPVLKQLITLSSYPLKEFEENFSVDATGFSTPNHEKWFDIKRAKPSKRRLYKKAHIFSGVRVNIITAVEVTKGTSADSPQFQQLLTLTAKKFKIKEVSADMAYSSKDNLQAIVDIGAFPYIPFKKKTSKTGGLTLWHRMHDYFLQHYDEFMQHYHLRSNAETLNSMLKRKVGTYLRSKKETAQTNEVLTKCLVHNLLVLIAEIFELGVEPNFCANAQNAPKIKVKR